MDIHERPSLSLKRRQGENAATSLATDLCELHVFTSGLSEHFPRELLSATSRMTFDSKVDSNKAQAPPSEADPQGSEKTLTLRDAYCKLAELTGMYRTLEGMFQKEREERIRVTRSLESEIQELKKASVHVRENNPRQAYMHTQTETVIDSDGQRKHIDNTVARDANNTQQSQSSGSNDGSLRPVTPPENTGKENDTTAAPAATVADGRHNEANTTVAEQDQTAAPPTSDAMVDDRHQNEGNTAAQADRWPGLTSSARRNRVTMTPWARTNRERVDSLSPTNSGNSTASSNRSEHTLSRGDSRQDRGDSRDPPFRKYMNKREYRSQKQSSRPTTISGSKVLTGKTPEKPVTVYLENIHKDDEWTSDDIIAMVKDHSKKRMLRVMSACVVFNKVCQDTVGCRITVPESRVEDVLCEGFWPNNIHCRKWQRYRPKSRKRWRQEADEQQDNGQRYMHDDTDMRQQRNDERGYREQQRQQYMYQHNGGTHEKDDWWD